MHLPVKEVQGRPVLGHRSCLGCRVQVGLGLAAGCPEAYQHSHREGKNPLILRERSRNSNSLITKKKSVTAIVLKKM